MGIPKFARLLCERYPCLCQLVCDMEVPEFDNLYLDMNGIIHNCTHDNNGEVSLARPEAEVIKSIFSYIEMLFRVVRPKKLFFMAVDGVAPRAKMNQQRARRFMSAKNAEVALAKANQHGIVMSAGDLFDSNCITPGTAFMHRLHGYLKYFVYMKMNTDPLWKGVKVIYSGHDDAGEGEHKIMSYIRYIRAQPNYDPATKHCLYGLDADLIILGLVSHEPYFALLREEVTYRQKKKIPTRPFDQKSTRFYLLHLSLLREYISMDFSKLQENYPDLFDLESLIDDWVLMVCFLGNDFLPHLANFHTHENVLPYLCKAYMAVFGKMQGYLNEAGHLNLPRLEIFFEKLSEVDRENFEVVYEDFVDSTCSHNSSVMHSSLIHNPPEFWSGKRHEDTDVNRPFSEAYESEWDDEMDNAFLEYRVEYYAEKLGVEEVERDLLVSLKLSYIRGLQWNLYYYYECVASWKWFYPYHYSPFVTDLRGFQSVNLKFVKDGSPLPFCQQMAVLPPASRHLVPKAYQDLMVDPSSPLISFYPEEFETDLNGKRNDWESVVKLPFIDQELLMSVLATREELLTAEEQLREVPGCCLLYTYDRSMQGQDIVSNDSDLLPTIKNCKVRCQCLAAGIFNLDPAKVVHGLLINESPLNSTHPTFNQLTYERSLRCIRPRTSLFSVDSIVLSLFPNVQKSLEEVAALLLGTWVMVKWPHCIPALCVAVSSMTDRYLCRIVDRKRWIEHQTHSEKSMAEWTKMTLIAEDELYSKEGIEARGSEIMVHCYLPCGLRYSCDPRGQPKVMFSWKQSEEVFPYATILPCADAKQYFLRGRSDLKSLYPVGAVVFSMATATYGLPGNVIACLQDAQIRVRLKREIRTSMWSVISIDPSKLLTSWFSADQLARDLNMSRFVVSRLTGTVPLFKETGNEKECNWENIGFNLKLTKMSMEMPGYTSKDLNGNWVYSAEVRYYLSEYKRRFPEVIKVLTEVDKSVESLYTVDIWKDDERGKRMAELSSWLGALPFHTLKWQPCGTSYVKSDYLSVVERALEKAKAANRHSKGGSFVADLKTDDVYSCTSVLGTWEPDPHKDHRLLDRVIFVRPGFSVPVGLTGTIIQLPPVDKLDTTDILVLFDEAFAAAFRLGSSKKRSAYYVPLNALLNMSHGERMNQRLPSSSSLANQALPLPSAIGPRRVIGNSTKKFVKREIPGRLASKWQQYSTDAVLDERSARNTSSMQKPAVQSTSLNEATAGLTSLAVTDNHSVEPVRPVQHASLAREEPVTGFGPSSNFDGFYPEVTNQPVPTYCNQPEEPLPSQGYQYFEFLAGNPLFQGNIYPQAPPFPYGVPPGNPYGFESLSMLPIRPAPPFPRMMYPMQVDEVERLDALPYRPQGTGHPLQTYQMSQQEILAECSDDEIYNPGRLPSSTVWAPERETAVSLLETIKHYGYDGLPKLERPLPTDATRTQPSYGASLAKSEVRTQEADFPGCSQRNDYWRQ